MRLVLDASVAVAAARAREVSHRAAQARVGGILRGDDELIVPTLFAVEVGAALAREGVPLCTLDGEMLRRGASACEVIPP